MNCPLRCPATRVDPACHARPCRTRSRGRVPERDLEDLRVIVSELTTNALLYGAGAIHLHVPARGEAWFSGEVIDEGSGFERAVAERGIHAVGGNGLHMVGALTERWGIHEGTSHVWFKLAPGAPDALPRRGWAPSSAPTSSTTERGCPAGPAAGSAGSGGIGHAVRRHGAVVVEPQQRDHVGDVVLRVDPRARRSPACRGRPGGSRSGPPRRARARRPWESRGAGRGRRAGGRARGARS